MSSPVAPSWPHCAQGADPATDRVGCHGIQVPGHTRCLAHLADTDRDTYLAGLTPGAAVDHRGTTFTNDLLGRVLNALCDSATGIPRLGVTKFQGATFQGDADFGSATFEGDADFGSAIFQGDADFGWATFEGAARFGSAMFRAEAWFGDATFKGDADFGSATFEDDVWFEDATFEGDIDFAW